MKVLLINPPVTLFPGDLPSVVPPLGIAYIAAVLEENKINVQILDAIAEDQTFKENSSEQKHFGMEWRQIEEEIKKRDPQVVGVSCSYSIQSANAHKVVDIAKKVNQKIATVMGGAHPSSLPKTVLGNPNLDFCVIGEGENTILELLESLDNEKHLSEIQGLGWKKKGEPIINEPRPPNDSIDSLPFPARHLLPMEKYFKAGAWHGFAIKNRRVTSMITSRGCPYNCNFCSVYTVWGRNWRPRDPKEVVNEIEHLVEEYDVKEIHFEDDNLTLDKERAKEIFDEIIRRDLDIYWAAPNGVRIDRIDKELLEKAKESGCYRLDFGIEHGSPEFRENVIGKAISQSQAKRTIEYCKKLGIWANGFFIIGFPEESEETVEKTLTCAKELGFDSASFFFAMPYPATRLFEQCKEEGYIPQDLDWNNLRTSRPLIETEDFSKEDVRKWHEYVTDEFIKYRLKEELKPLNLARRIWHIRSIDDLKFMFRFAKAALSR